MLPGSAAASVETAVAVAVADADADADADAVAHAERASELAAIIPMTRCFTFSISVSCRFEKKTTLHRTHSPQRRDVATPATTGIESPRHPGSKSDKSDPA
jgi:hypothetical protein